MNHQVYVCLLFVTLTACGSFLPIEDSDASTPTGMLTSVVAEAGAGDATLKDAGEVIQHPSCVGLPKTCGSNGQTDCCIAFVVPGGQYDRSSDPAFPATISTFNLDAYEITVGRFRRFFSAYAQDMIAPGAGSNPHNPSDPGWDQTWNASLPLDKAALEATLKCRQIDQTWTDYAIDGNENRPINCITWFMAEAFCIWDGGRLPTEAEWNYAAAGGSAQRLYPWGVTEPTTPTTNSSFAVQGCFWNGSGTCTGVTNIATVGSVSAGNGLWGHADMAGNLWEWVQDGYLTPYLSGSCTDCALLANTPGKVIRGGSFIVDQQGVLTTSHRNGANPPTYRSNTTGARCARLP